MRPIVGVIVALALAVVAFGSAPAAGLAAPTSAGPSLDGCGCPTIASVRVTPAAVIGPEVNFTFYGHAVRGWGPSNATISDPGPNISVYLGDKVFLTLLANDTLPHNWFLDYNDNNQPDVGEPSSPDFNALAGPKVVVWNFTADRPGEYHYRCRYHPASMIGTIIILGEERLPPAGPGIGLIPGILLVSLAGVLVFAVVYHARAVRATKRRR